MQQLLLTLVGFLYTSTAVQESPNAQSYVIRQEQDDVLNQVDASKAIEVGPGGVDRPSSIVEEQLGDTQSGESSKDVSTGRVIVATDGQLSQEDGTALLAEEANGKNDGNGRVIVATDGQLTQEDGTPLLAEKASGENDGIADVIVGSEAQATGAIVGRDAMDKGDVSSRGLVSGKDTGSVVSGGGSDDERLTAAIEPADIRLYNYYKYRPVSCMLEMLHLAVYDMLMNEENETDVEPTVSGDINATSTLGNSTSELGANETADEETEAEEQNKTNGSEAIVTPKKRKKNLKNDPNRPTLGRMLKLLKQGSNGALGIMQEVRYKTNNYSADVVYEEDSDVIEAIKTWHTKNCDKMLKVSSLVAAVQIVLIFFGWCLYTTVIEPRGLLTGKEKRGEYSTGFQPIPFLGCIWRSCTLHAWRVFIATYFCHFCMWMNATSKAGVQPKWVPPLLLAVWTLWPPLSYIIVKAGGKFIYPVNEPYLIFVLLYVGFTRYRLRVAYKRGTENGVRGCDIVVGAVCHFCSIPQMASFVEWQEKKMFEAEEGDVSAKSRLSSCDE